MNAWALLVVSSEGQTESLPDQRKRAEAAVAAKGWTLERAFEGASTGREGPRKLLRTLVSELRALPAEARPAWVMMIRQDRVGRGRIDESLFILHEIRDLGPRLWLIDKGGELRLDSATDDFIAAAEAYVSTRDNELKRERLRNVYARRRQMGRPVSSKRPYGLRRDGRDGPDVEVEREAVAVRHAFALRVAGESLTAIAHALQPIAPPRVRLRDGVETVIEWLPQTVQRLLRQRAYIGVIVDEVTFQRAQIITESVRTRGWDISPVYPWPLTGAIRCWCGAAMHGQAGGHTAPGKRWRYYRCNAPARHKASRGTRADRVEAEFYELLLRIKAEPGRYRRPLAGPDPELLDRAIRSLRADIDANARDRAEVWDLRSTGAIRLEDVQERLDALAIKRDDLTRSLAELEHQRAGAAAMREEDVLTDEALARAVELWKDPRVSAKTRRSFAVALSLHVGGLYIAPDGELTIGMPENAPAVHRRRGAHRLQA